MLEVKCWVCGRDLGTWPRALCVHDYITGIFDAAMALRMSSNGSGDPIANEGEVLAYLKKRIARWLPRRDDSEVDAAALMYIKAIVAEYELRTRVAEAAAYKEPEPFRPSTAPDED